MSKRLIAKTNEPVTYPLVGGSAERGEVLSDALTLLNLEGETRLHHGDIDPGPEVDTGEISFKPFSEFLTELTAAPAIVYGAPTGNDTFTEPAGSPDPFSLVSHTSDSGNTWSVADGLPRLSIDRATDRVVITTGGDTDRGRWAQFLTSGGAPIIQAELMIQYEFMYVTGAATTGTVIGSNGLWARSTGTTANDMFEGLTALGYIRGCIHYGTAVPSLNITRKLPGGVDTVIEAADFPAGLGIIYTMRLSVSAEGFVVLQCWPTAAGTAPSGSPNVELTTTIAEAATGGSLEDGTFGFQDNNISTAFTRVVDNWRYHNEVGVSEAADWEIVPVEPTDSSPIGGVYCGLLNVGQYGVLQPNMVFKRGDGATRLNNPNFNINRSVANTYHLGDTCPVDLKAAGNARLGTPTAAHGPDDAIRVYGIDITYDKKTGLVTEAPILRPE